MIPARRPTLTTLALLGLLSLAAVAVAAEGPVSALRPRLSVEPVETVREIWVELAGPDGAPRRTLLRRTGHDAVPGTSGGDPAGRAAFATWTEGDGTAWYAYSRDAGATWSEARELRSELRLRDASVAPGRLMPEVPNGFALHEEGRLFLVQFHTVGLPEWREALRGAGVEVLRFFPRNAHVVRMPPALVPAVASLDFVARVEPYEPWYRLEPALRAWQAGGAESDGPGPAVDEVRVRVSALEWGPVGKRRILADALSWGARVADYWPSGHILELWVDREQLRRLAAHDDVLWIDRWSAPEDDMDLVRIDSGADWVEDNFGYCGQGVRGEVMDSGIQDDHMDFDGVLLHTPVDLTSHGTSSYGVVFGNGDRDGDGDPKATGHLPCAEQGIFADNGRFGGDRFAHTQELKGSPYFASFQSNSWGSARTTAYNSVSSEMDDIIWRLDIAITQSQSNAGNRSSRPQAWAKNIISVGGIKHLDTLDTADDAWGFGASIGPAADGRIKPDVHYWYDFIYTTTTGNGYTATFNGTSASTPEVSGVLGLMVQMWSENVWGTDPVGSTVFERQPHASTIKALLINNAQQYGFSGAGDDLTRVHQGWGRPSVRLAKERAGNSFVVNEEQPLELGQTALYQLDVPAGESELKVTMVYPDPPGTTSATLHRINDLNLRVTSPSAEVYHGNVGLDLGVESTPGGSPNGVDTVENVFVLGPEAGTWVIEIEAAEVNQDAHLDTPEDDAVFALVVTGAGGEVQLCGNGIREGAEECDDGDLAGLACGDLGCSGGGTLACTPGCIFDASACSACPPCGDGQCVAGESCYRCAADCISESAVACGNGVCETIDGEDCLSCPDDCNGVQSGNPANRYCCGGGAGDNPIGCADSRCHAAGNTCLDLPSVAYCCGDGSCTGAEDLASCAIDCTPLTPGEASPPPANLLLVPGFDDATGTLTVSYQVACAATSHTIEYGALTPVDVSSYNWAGQECGLGTVGAYDWQLPAGPESLFFVVVGHDGSTSGSYGRDSLGVERPEDTTSTSCPVPRDLSFACE